MLQNKNIWQPGDTMEQIQKRVCEMAIGFYMDKNASALSLGITVKTLDAYLKKEVDDVREITVKLKNNSGKSNAK